MKRLDGGLLTCSQAYNGSEDPSTFGFHVCHRYPLRRRVVVFRDTRRKNLLGSRVIGCGFRRVEKRYGVLRRREGLLRRQQPREPHKGEFSNPIEGEGSKSARSVATDSWRG